MKNADMVELVDISDLGSDDLNVVGVQVPLSVQKNRVYSSTGRAIGF